MPVPRGIRGGFGGNMPQDWPTLEDQLEVMAPAIVATCRSVIGGTVSFRSLGACISNPEDMRRYARWQRRVEREREERARWEREHEEARQREEERRRERIRARAEAEARMAAELAERQRQFDALSVYEQEAIRNRELCAIVSSHVLEVLRFKRVPVNVQTDIAAFDGGWRCEVVIVTGATGQIHREYRWSCCSAQLNDAIHRVLTYFPKGIETI